jgi:diguanylate cyclase (GGDEF)-like protein
VTSSGNVTFRRLGPVRGYVIAVMVGGFALLGYLLVSTDFGSLSATQYAIFSSFVVVGELFPIRVPRGNDTDEITTSTAFSFALLLSGGPLAAVAAQAAGSIVADSLHRKPLWKSAFNAAQYTLSLGLSALVLSSLTALPRSVSPFAITPNDLAGILAAAGTFYVSNTVLTGVGVGLAQRARLLRYVWDDLMRQGLIEGLLLSLSPMVLVAANWSLLMIPLLALPLAAVYKHARTSLENAQLVSRLERSLRELTQLNRLNEHQATHDMLTDLPNRVLFRERVERAIEYARERRLMTAVMIIDLDRFKDINDTLGHHNGDLLLQQVGPRLREALEEGGTIARLGGDEFGVLLSDVWDRMAAGDAAERIHKALEQPFIVDGLSLDVEASIGIALFPESGQEVDGLIQRADLAMYVAKAGRQGYEIYAPQFDQYSATRLALLGELRRAIEEGQLVLHYQPKVHFRTGIVEGVEALVRWQHPERGLIFPDEFIPFAEHTTLIRPLAHFVLDHALRQCRAWRRSGLDVSVAVNLSVRNLLDLSLPDEVARLLSKWELPPGALDLEITESTIMAEPMRAMEVLTRLSEMGVGLSLDDFGTGYSSLAYLRRLPVDEIKIDKSFVLNMASDEDDASIVRSTIDLGHNLGLRVVAEGVENGQIWNQLARLGCDVAQGYYLSRPVPAERLSEWLEAASDAPDQELPVRPTGLGYGNGSSAERSDATARASSASVATNGGPNIIRSPSMPLAQPVEE